MKNVLFVISDDLLQVTTKPELIDEFPNFKQFQQDATTYENAFVQVPHCGPSRMSFLTGRYNHNVGSAGYYLHVSDNNEKNNIGSNSVTKWAQSKGYTVFGTSKIYHFKQTNIDYIQNYNWVDTEIDRDNDKIPNDWAIKYYPQGNENKLTDWVAKENALTFIDNHNFANPLFMIIGFRKPHTKYITMDTSYTQLVTTEYFENLPNLTKVADYPRTYTQICDAFTNINKINNADSANTFTVNERSIPTLTNPASTAYINFVKEVRRAYVRTVKAVDQYFGEVLNKLKAINQYDNTVIVFTGDHGFSLGDHGRWCKRNLYESATKVPLMIKQLNSVDGGTVEKTVYPVVDLFRKTFELAGVTNSFQSQYRKNTEDVALTFLPICYDQTTLENNGCSDTNYDAIGVALRSQKWRYIRVLPYNNGIQWFAQPLSEELYEIETDPDNIYSVHEKYPFVLKRHVYLMYEEANACDRSFANLCVYENGQYQPDPVLLVTNAPTDMPSASPTTTPSASPTVFQTSNNPTTTPTETPTEIHATRSPSASPSNAPSESPTMLRTSAPTISPTPNTTTVEAGPIETPFIFPSHRITQSENSVLIQTLNMPLLAVSFFYLSILLLLRYRRKYNIN